MTLDAFCAALTACAARATWYPQAPSGAYALRGTVHGIRVCPLTMVAYATMGKIWPTTHVLAAALALGLRAPDRDAITQAADGRLHPDAMPLRARLWACVGFPLTEEPRGQ